MTADSPHVFTLTGNLLAERTQVFDRWTAGATQRATSESFQVGGKGINVAKMLTRLGAPNTALCFIGGPTGAECEAWLRSRKFSLRTFATTTPTRTGLVVRAAGQSETTFLGLDATPDPAAIRACAEALRQVPTGSVLAVCGSIPGWESSAFDVLRDAFHRWPERGPLVVDTYGPPLTWLANEAAALVRINRTELLSLFPQSSNVSTGELLRLAREKFRALRWAVSDGAGPLWFMAEHHNPETIPTPVVRQVSATGSGDVMLAGALHARFNLGLSWRDAVGWSLPYAAANAAHAEIAEFPEPVTAG